MLQALQNVFRLPELRTKILLTLGILLIYRLVAHVPVPGVNREALAAFFNQEGAAGVLGQFYNLLSGGALANFSVLAMGVYPYITASIIIQLLTPILPFLEELSKEGEQGRQKINQYTFWLAVPLAFLQGLGQIAIMQQSGVFPDFGFSAFPNAVESLATLFSLTAGTMFAVWLGELITERGVGNGLSIIIMAGILASIPTNVFQLSQRENGWLLVLLFIAILLITLYVVVVIQQGERRVQVKYKRQVRGQRQVGGQSSYVPLKVNATGMIPIILAQSILIFPSLIAGYFIGAENPSVAGGAQWVADWLGPSKWPYWLAYFTVVVAFTYFYTDIVFRQQNVAETLRRQGGVIEGFREGPPTKTYLQRVMMRITFVGALFLGLMAVLPFIITALLGLFGVVVDPVQDNLFIVSSVGLLIVVGVVLDTMRQLEAQLTMRHYEKFIGR